jgi:hypothetical protein
MVKAWSPLAAVVPVGDPAPLVRQPQNVEVLQPRQMGHERDVGQSAVVGREPWMLAPTPPPFHRATDHPFLAEPDALHPAARMYHFPNLLHGPSRPSALDE